MELFIPLALVFVLGLALRRGAAPAPPQIIYVHEVAPRPSGCGGTVLVLLIVGLLLLYLLGAVSA